MQRWKMLVIAPMALVLVGLAVAANPPRAQSSVTPSGIRWEYTYYSPGTREDNIPMSQIMQKLNEMGDQGWELMSINAHNGSWVKCACYVFKRRK